MKRKNILIILGVSLIIGIGAFALTGCNPVVETGKVKIQPREKQENKTEITHHKDDVVTIDINAENNPLKDIGNYKDIITVNGRYIVDQFQNKDWIYSYTNNLEGLTLTRMTVTFEYDTPDGKDCYDMTIWDKLAPGETSQEKRHYLDGENYEPISYALDLLDKDGVEHSYTIDVRNNVILTHMILQ